MRQPCQIGTRGKLQARGWWFFTPLRPIARAGAREASLLYAYPAISAAVEVEDLVLAARARHSYQFQVSGSIRRQSWNSRQAESGYDGGVDAFQSGADRRPGKSPNREGSNYRG